MGCLSGIFSNEVDKDFMKVGFDDFEDVEGDPSVEKRLEQVAGIGRFFDDELEDAFAAVLHGRTGNDAVERRDHLFYGRWK